MNHVSIKTKRKIEQAEHKLLTKKNVCRYKNKTTRKDTTPSFCISYKILEDYLCGINVHFIKNLYWLTVTIKFLVFKCEFLQMINHLKHHKTLLVLDFFIIFWQTKN